MLSFWICYVLQTNASLMSFEFFNRTARGDSIKRIGRFLATIVIALDYKKTLVF
ncbi:hypothetical protein P799_08685 [Lysinibacillus sphaericus CBAM5]|uniref:Uncharacterized protein n=1 Tax=Lysinibacillus sphaericus CBAM5 TaxID=1400869 RepID=W7RSA0_LYSSH|nr:hypothetical protein P799_08685 [Lysinibacillus sphaericus CBAM5]